VRSEGGIGVVLANQTKHMDLAGVAAIQAIVFAIGIVQDALIGAFKSLVCPYAALKTERSRS
jgi:ABC-type nitrate/sulfonate/bicarbonate transport system permease component